MTKLDRFLCRYRIIASALFTFGLVTASAQVGLTRDWRWGIPAVLFGIGLGKVSDALAAKSVEAERIARLRKIQREDREWGLNAAL